MTGTVVQAFGTVGVLGIEHPRKYRGANCGNPGNAENPNSQDTSIYMLVSSHSSVLNPLNSSAYRFAPTKLQQKVTQKQSIKTFSGVAPPPGNSRKINKREQRALLHTVRSNRHATLFDITNILPTKMSIDTLKRRLKEVGM